MYTKVIILLAALSSQSVYSSHYHGPTAKPVVLHNGYLANTHEVAAAKNAHLSTPALGYDRNYGNIRDEADYKDLTYHGPTAIPNVLDDGHIADTREVAAAKAEHFAAVDKAKIKTHGGEYEDEYSGKYAGKHHGDSDHAAPYNGPLATPDVLKSGYLADTHEVAAAKAKHLVTVSKAKADNHGGEFKGDYSGTYAGEPHGYSGRDVPYHGPLAKPVVLKSGYLADTHEVAAAKAEHLVTVSKAKADNHGGEFKVDYSGTYAGEPHGYSGHAVPYHGPLAKPILLKSGYLADTHEVAAAKEHHLQALQQDGHHTHYSYHH